MGIGGMQVYLGFFVFEGVVFVGFVQVDGFEFVLFDLQCLQFFFGVEFEFDFLVDFQMGEVFGIFVVGQYVVYG